MKKSLVLLLLLSVFVAPAHAILAEELTLTQGNFRHAFALSEARHFEVLNTLGKLNFVASDGGELVLRGNSTAPKPLKLRFFELSDGSLRIEVKYPNELHSAVQLSGGSVSIKNMSGAKNVSVVSINGKTTVTINGKVVTGRESDSSGMVDLTVEVPKQVLRNLLADADEIQMRGFRDGVIRATQFEFRSSLRVSDLDSSQGVAIHTLSGEASVNNVQGDVRVSSTSGDVLATQIAGDLQVESLSGSFTGSSIEGNVRAKMTSGDVGLKKLKGDAEIETLSGDVEVEEMEGSLKVGTTSGDVRSAQVRGNVGVVSLSGDIRFANPDALSESAETMSGEVRGKTKSAAQFEVKRPAIQSLCVPELKKR